MTTIVRTQEALDAAIAAGADDIIIQSPRGVWLAVSDSATVRASGSAIVEAWDSATVHAWDSATVRASGSAIVEAWDSATVHAWDSATVRAWGSATVHAWDSATVRASGSATVRAWDYATVEAAKYVAVHAFSQSATLSGGVVIDMTQVDTNGLDDWLALTGVETRSDGRLVVYKAVDDSLRSGYGFAYPVGETVTDGRWVPNHRCGDGLHFSPTPGVAKGYFEAATRFLRCLVLPEDVRCIDASKLKARTAFVECEVDLWTHKEIAS